MQNRKNFRIISNTFNSRGERVKIVLYDSYVRAIQNSVGSRIFKNLYAYIDGKKQDIARNGRLSCDIFVSSILLLYGLIDQIHGTVDECVAQLKYYGWYNVQKPRKGAILVWEAKKSKNGEVHKHIGFYIGNSYAISNVSTKRVPATHHWTYHGKRKVEQIFWNKKFV